MTIYKFINDHVRYNLRTDMPEVHSLAILNAAPGQECMRMCGLFGVPMSSAMVRGGPDEEYVSFIADSNACASYWIGDTYKPPKKFRFIYYPDIEPIIDEIFAEFPELAEQMPGAMKQAFDSSELYKTLGMETIDES